LHELVTEVLLGDELGQSFAMSEFVRPANENEARNAPTAQPGLLLRGMLEAKHSRPNYDPCLSFNPPVQMHPGPAKLTDSMLNPGPTLDFWKFRRPLPQSLILTTSGMAAEVFIIP
jgi:hypothetical protein